MPGSVDKGFLPLGWSFWPPNYSAPPANHVECWFLSLGVVLEAIVLTYAEPSILIESDPSSSLFSASESGNTFDCFPLHTRFLNVISQLNLGIVEH